MPPKDLAFTFGLHQKQVYLQIYIDLIGRLQMEGPVLGLSYASIWNQACILLPSGYTFGYNIIWAANRQLNRNTKNKQANKYLKPDFHINFISLYQWMLSLAKSFWMIHISFIHQKAI